MIDFFFIDFLFCLQLLSGVGYASTGAEHMHYSAHYEKFESVLKCLGAVQQQNQCNGKKIKQHSEATKCSSKQITESEQSGSVSQATSDRGDGGSTSDSDEDSSSDDSAEPRANTASSHNASLEARSRAVRGRVQ